MGQKSNDTERARFVGDDFAYYPGISQFGALLRIVRLNHVRPSEYLSAFGLRVRRRDDLSHVLTFSATRTSVFRQALALELTSDFELESWLPFKSAVAIFERDWQLRCCLECLRVSYHTLLFQLPWCQTCPWHGSQLTTACPWCSRPFTVDGSTERRLLICACGYDPLDEVAACYGDQKFSIQTRAWIDAYLAWAAQERAQCTLVAPEGASSRTQALGSLAVLPCHLRGAGAEKLAIDVHQDRLSYRRLGSDTRDAEASLVKLAGVERRASAVLELPQQFEHAVVQIACSLARKLPPNSLSDSEMTWFFDTSGQEIGPDFKPAKRKSHAGVRWLPPMLIGKRRFLDLSCLHKTAQHLMLALMENVLGPRFPDEPAPEELDEPSRRVLLAACQRILARSYSEGLRTVLSRDVPELFDLKRDRPHLSEPWAIIRRADWRLEEVRIVWVKASRLPD